MQLHTAARLQEKEPRSAAMAALVLLMASAANAQQLLDHIHADCIADEMASLICDASSVQCCSRAGEASRGKEVHTHRNEERETLRTLQHSEKTHRTHLATLWKTHRTWQHSEKSNAPKKTVGALCTTLKKTVGALCTTRKNKRRTLHHSEKAVNTSPESTSHFATLFRKQFAFCNTLQKALHTLQHYPKSRPHFAKREEKEGRKKRKKEGRKERQGRSTTGREF